MRVATAWWRRIELTDTDAERLKLSSPDEALVLVVAAVADQGKDISVNLAAPIVINSTDLVGMQVVLQDTRYSVKHPLMEQLSNRCKEGSAEATEAKAA